MARGRKPIEITSAELQEVIKNTEAAQPDGKFPNRSALWNALEASEWAKSRTPRPLTAQVAMVLAQKANLEIQTPVGKRGREKGCGPILQGIRRVKSFPLEVIDAQKKRFNPQYERLVDSAAKGSRKAAIKLMCLDCTCEQKKEIALCTIKRCPLFNFRPYKRMEDINDPDSTGTDV